MKIKLIRDQITPSLNFKQQGLAILPKQALDYWISKTPKLTGNARSKTNLRQTTISADYDYALKLDQGYSAKSPEGMSKPTERFIKQQLDRIIKG